MRRIDVGALLVAVLAHAALIEFARTRPNRISLDSIDEMISPNELVAIDLTSDPEPANNSGSTEVDANARSTSGPTSSGLGMAMHRPRGLDSQPSSTQEQAPTPTAGERGAEAGALPPPGAENEYGDPDPAPQSSLLPSLLTPNMLGLTPELQGAPAPTAAQPREAMPADTASRAIASTLRARDTRVGVSIPAVSVVQGAVTEAMRSAAVSHNTRATVVVHLGQDGSLQSARVVSASGGEASGWDALAKSVAANLGSKKLSLGSVSAKGAIITITATQKHVFPTGTAKAAKITPVCANAVLNEVVVANQKQGPPTEDGIPIFVDENGLPCIPVGFAGVSDLSNIGAKKQIQVQTEVKVTIPGEADLPEVVSEVDTNAPWVKKSPDTRRPNLPAKIRRHLRNKEKKK